MINPRLPRAAKAYANEPVKITHMIKYGRAIARPRQHAQLPERCEYHRHQNGVLNGF